MCPTIHPVAVAVVLCCVSGVAVTSHFRGAVIQWRPLDAHNFDGRIEISHRIGFRSSFENDSYECTTADLGTTRLYDSRSDDLECRSGCSGDVGSMDFYCVDFDVIEDWTAGERTYISNIGINLTNFEASFIGCCWISLVVYEIVTEDSPGVSWEIRVKGNLSPRSDNGLINSSPITTTTPIVRLQSGNTHTIRIPVQDADQDTVRCRWAQHRPGNNSECADICNSLPEAVIDEDTCVLTWSATHGIGWFAVAIQIEDFMTPSSTTPMSSVPLQFLINVFASDQHMRPSLVPGETPPDNSCIPVPFNTTYTADLVVASGNLSINITRFLTSSPFGLVTSPVIQSQFNSTIYYSNVTWTPLSSQFGLNLFCFRAVSSTGLETEQSCITLLGGISGPSALPCSISPTGEISPTASTIWKITFDRNIFRPSSSRYIRFYEALSGRNIYNFDVTSLAATYPAADSGCRTLMFSLDPNFTPGLEYYVLLDNGVAVGNRFCGEESVRVTDRTFWTFTIADSSPCTRIVITAVFGWLLFLVLLVILVIAAVILLYKRRRLRSIKVLKSSKTK